MTQQPEAGRADPDTNAGGSVEDASPQDRERLAQRRAFGAALRTIRSGSGLSQERLARAAGLDRTYLGAVELGRRNISLHAMWQLAHALDVTPAAFFTGQPGTLSCDDRRAAVPASDFEAEAGTR